MNKLSAFVGHSFNEDDEEINRIFLGYFDRIKNLVVGFSWDHAEKAEPKILSEKVKEKMIGKNLFIGICTAKERVISPEKLKKGGILNNFLKSREDNYELKTSDWIIQEI